MAHSARRQEIVVFDQAEACPYLPGETARLPLRWSLGVLSGRELDQRLAAGDRRSGSCLYQPCCPDCSQCQSLRVDVNRFRPSRTQQRVERRGRRLFKVGVGAPQMDPARLRLFNSHREQRGLGCRTDECDETSYQAFLMDSCCQTLEITYHLDQKLVGVAICDRGETCLSAVYCYYDLACAHLSPGVFSILTEMQFCRDWQMQYLYLGYYVAGSPHMSYKACYLPHERLISGRWQSFDRATNPHS